MNDEVRWRLFCREVETRIRAVRALEARPCRDCQPCPHHQEGDRAQDDLWRACSTCRALLPIEAFNRDRTKPLGRRYVCRDCQRIVNRQTNERKRRRVVREIVRAVAS